MSELRNIATKFAGRIAAAQNDWVDADKEAQLAGHVKTLLEQVVAVLGNPADGLDFWEQTRLNTQERTEKGRVKVVKPDISVYEKGDHLAIGHIELKAPGKGANPDFFAGHDKEQYEKYESIDGLNLIYTDGLEWSLFQNKERKVTPFKLGDANEAELKKFFAAFFVWQPTVPHKRRELATYIAGHCKMIREAVTSSLKKPNSEIGKLKEEWQEALFPHTNDEQFADYYAQTITYALFLAYLQGAKKLSSGDFAAEYLKGSDILASALKILDTKKAKEEIGLGLEVLERSLLAIDRYELFKQSEKEQLWLYFYEDFLAAYDPKLRKDAGAYYTPIQAVKFQTRLVADILEKEFNKPLAYADDGVNFIDPAAGTGTYLVAALDEAIARIEEKQGKGAVPAKITDKLLKNMHGFEIMIGPYAAAVLRVAQTLKKAGTDLDDDENRIKIYLNDTLASPGKRTRGLDFTNAPARTLQEETKRAKKIKNEVPIMVCIGNPPYDRHDAKKGKSNWIRYGDGGKGDAKKQEKVSLLADFVRPLRGKGECGKHLKNIYNLYIYFWRWALWKVCEPKHHSYPQKGNAANGDRGGIVSFITASSYLDGPAFAGMRQYMQELFDEIYIVDLGGDSIGTRKNENVFSIRTPVAIAICVRKAGNAGNPRKAKTYYQNKIAGTRKEKLKWLDEVKNKNSIDWQKLSLDNAFSFLPKPAGKYVTNPKLVDLFPFQHSGIEFKKTWPIGEDKKVLEARWQEFETMGREEKQKYLPKKALDKYDPKPEISRYGFRSFDRQYAFLDKRISYTLRPDLSKKDSDKQIYLTGLLAANLGGGPAATISTDLPDRHCFNGRGGKDVIPLWKNKEATDPNISREVLAKLEATYGKKVAPKDFFAYTYAVLFNPGYSARFYMELGQERGPRLTITKNYSLFQKTAKIGKKLIFLHSWGERMKPTPNARIPDGKAKCTEPILKKYPNQFKYGSGTISIDGGEFGPVAPEIWNFEVSGFKPVQHWVKTRLYKGTGRRSAPMDETRPEWISDTTEELVLLLSIMEHTIAKFPTLNKCLDEILTGDLFTERELLEKI